MSVLSRVHVVPEMPLPPAGSGLTVVGTEFTNVSNDDIEEVWRDHVLTLLKGKSETAAVNTTFLLNRLFLVSVTVLLFVTRALCSQYLEQCLSLHCKYSTIDRGMEKRTLL